MALLAFLQAFILPVAQERNAPASQRSLSYGVRATGLAGFLGMVPLAQVDTKTRPRTQGHEAVGHESLYATLTEHRATHPRLLTVLVSHSDRLERVPRTLR